MTEESNLYEKKYIPIEDMTAEQIKEELQVFRTLWSWTPEQVRFWLSTLNSAIAVTKRMGENVVGTLGACEFDLKSIEVTGVSRGYNFGKGQATYTDKTTTVPVGMIADYSFINNEEVVNESMDGALTDAKEEDVVPLY